MLPWDVRYVRGKITLGLPVTYQNLLDGVVEFILNNGHGGTNTVIPTPYTPNNSLIINGDQGTFNIENVHPGNALYTELDLSASWSGTGKTLISINVKPGPRLIGINGLVTWPSVNSVTHVQPVGDVKVILGNTESSAKIMIKDRFGVETSYDNRDGIISLREADLTDAINRRLSLELIYGDDVYSTIFVLPETESENFSEEGYLGLDGSLGYNAYYITTDFIDLYDVDEYVYSAQIDGITNVAGIVAYNEDKTFNRIILSGTRVYDNVHVKYDGTYRYIRACGMTIHSKSLKLYFRTRG